MRLNYLIKLSVIAFLLACETSQKTEERDFLQSGKWLMHMKLAEGAVLPFNFTLVKKESNWQMTIINAKERITVKDIIQKGDSLFIQLPVFESKFFLRIVDNKHLEGKWVNYYKGDDYKITVTAEACVDHRFLAAADSQQKIAEKYQVTFSPDSDDAYDAIGLFSQKQSQIQGTFATETGDYRYLDGNITDDSVFLSTFDGSHAFLFKAAIKDSLLEGTFWSGTHFQEEWIAKVNPNPQLQNPDSLTFLNKEYNKIAFNFPNEEGKMISLEDKRYQNKAVIVQIMGSWCPNCLDETKYLTSLYEKYKEKDLEVIALAFERTKTKEKAFDNLKRLKKRTGAKYEFLLGGSTRSDKAEEALPMLNHIMSYPTAIFIDRKGNVQRVHTGFYGPSTGKYYDDFVKETEELIVQITTSSEI